ncbi:MAG: DUF2975 domain-containing protein [Leptospirales bacterium]
MKYLGKKSLSSFMHRLLQVSWYLVLIGSIFAGIFLSLAMFSTPVDEPGITAMGHLKFELFNEIKKDEEAFQFFSTTHIIIKMLVLVVLGAVISLLLTIIKKGQYVFKNFKNNIVFNESNVHMISKISKLLIIYSIVTFNFVLLMVSLILLILSAVFKNGTALQEEHDLTV